MKSTIHEVTRNRTKKARVSWRFVWFRGSYAAIETGSILPANSIVGVLAPGRYRSLRT